LLDLFNNVGGNLLLLALTDTSLVADPRVQDGFDFVAEGDLLLEFVDFGFELGDVLLGY
jgi:hypothetical protein